ncbi:MAG: flavodoxin family protein [Acidobacteria bacterium]|nr:flavodoxin family protein [Acidobacteriota bacterium]
MNVTVVNGNPDPGHGAFDGHLDALARHLGSHGHRCTLLPLRDLDIRQCTGCFSCWLRTPGRCVLPDRYEDVLRAYLASDLLVFASPLVMGFTSALLKRATDRIVPVVLPYIDGSSGECRHFPRYDHTPALAVLYEPEPDTDAEDLEILDLLWRRLARNAATRLAFVKPVSVDPEEVTHAIDRL